MEIVDLNANVRRETGKKGAKGCRKMGLLPGVLYGKDNQSVSLSVNPKDLSRVLHTHAGANAIIRLTVAGSESEPMTVVVKDLQIDPMKETMQHVDFCSISLDETIRTTVPFQLVGESPGVKQGGILEHSLWELEIETLPLNIPDYIDVDISGLQMGDSLSVADLILPDGVTVLTDWDAAVVSIASPRVEEVVEAAAAPEIEGAEPEVVGTKEKRPEKDAEKEEPKAEEKRKTKE